MDRLYKAHNDPCHGSALEGSDPHELAGGFEVCQMKGTHIGASEFDHCVLNYKVKSKI